MIGYMSDKKAFVRHMIMTVNTLKAPEDRSYRDGKFHQDWEIRVRGIHECTKYLNKRLVRRYVELSLANRKL
jgi:hypothetical protein